MDEETVDAAHDDAYDETVERSTGEAPIATPTAIQT